jgi:flagellar hook-length control protein FliK
LSLVASDVTAPASQPLPARSRPAPADATQPSSPFSSLLDTEAPTTAPRQAEAPNKPAKPDTGSAPAETKPTTPAAQPVASGQPSSQSPVPLQVTLSGETKTEKEGEHASKAGSDTATGTVKDGDKTIAAELQGIPLPSQPDSSAQQPTQPPATVLPTVADPAAQTTQTAQVAQVAGASVVAGLGSGKGTATQALSKAAGDGDHTAKADGSDSDQGAASAKVTVDGDLAPQASPSQGSSGSEDKPGPEQRHATAAATTGAPARKDGDAPERVRGELQAGATLDGAKPSVDATVPLAAMTPNQTANPAVATSPVHVAATSTDATVPIAGLAVAITAHAQDGHNRFEIRLDPPDLGRIDVRLDVDRGGNVTSHLVVEKAETLDLLRRDAPELERALQQAGLKTGDGGMQFTLRDQSFAGRDDGRQAQTTAQVVVPDADLTSVDTVAGSYARPLRLGGGVDIQV